MATKLLRKNEVMELTTLPQSTLYYLIGKGDFPQPIKLSKKTIAWPLDEVEAWLKGRKRANIGRQEKAHE